MLLCVRNKGAKQMLMEMWLRKLGGESKEPHLRCEKCEDESKASTKAITAFNRGAEGRAGGVGESPA